MSKDKRLLVMKIIKITCGVDICKYTATRFTGFNSLAVY
jgi:hypothetical protein